MALQFGKQINFVAGLLLTWCTALSCAHAQMSMGKDAAPVLALPQLGDGADMSPAAERRLGDRIARELYRDPDYIDDPVIMDYVQRLWLPLLAAAKQRGDMPLALEDQFAWEILLGRDRSVNAFALPGAYFGLHLGLVSTVTSRDELASVLAHELSHVTQRHISRLISRQNQQAPWLMGAMILGALAASKNPGAANAAIIGGQAVAAQTQLNFSRDMEREADRVGFGVMTHAGFEPQGFVTMFAKLQQASRLNDSGGFAYLRSHPLTTERISDMQNRLPFASVPLATSEPSRGDVEQAMVAARAKVLANSNADALRSWALQAKDSRFSTLTPSQQAGILYGAAFAALKLRNYAAATNGLAPLLLLTSDDAQATRLVQLLTAECALAQGDAQRAHVELNAIRGDWRRPEVLLSAQIFLQRHQPKQASDNLKSWLVEHPRDATAWQIMAMAQQNQGHVVAAIRAEAEVNISQLNYANALARLQAAQDAARSGKMGADYFEASIIDSRIKEVQHILKEQGLER